MKAIIFTEYGSPGVLRLEDVPKPTPNDDEVLVRVRAAAANPLDWHFMRGTPYFLRLSAGLNKPKHHMLGADIAGTVEAVGKNVTRFKIDDEVFGDLSSAQLGSFAEYKCAKEDLLALKPDNVTFEEAAAVPVVGFTALQGLRDTGKIRADDKVLINGASGGIGTFAVQFAKSIGAEVTGVCSTRNLDMVRSIGADHVIDYTKEDFTRVPQKFDLLFDTVGNRTVADYSHALTSNGRCVVAGFTTLPLLFNVLVLGGIASRTGSKTIGMMGSAHPNQADLQTISELLESKMVVPVIDKCYPLSETAAALAHLETGHARGKVIITVE